MRELHNINQNHELSEQTRALRLNIVLVYPDVNYNLTKFLLCLQSVLIEASKRNELMANKSTVSNSWFELLNTEVST